MAEESNQNLELHLDVAIDKVKNLSLDVRDQKYEVTSPIMGVAEGEYKYGADAFEEFIAKQSDKDKAPVGVASVKNDAKRKQRHCRYLFSASDN